MDSKLISQLIRTAEVLAVTMASYWPGMTSANKLHIATVIAAMRAFRIIPPMNNFNPTKAAVKKIRMLTGTVRSYSEATKVAPAFIIRSIKLTRAIGECLDTTPAWYMDFLDATLERYALYMKGNEIEVPLTVNVPFVADRSESGVKFFEFVPPFDFSLDTTYSRGLLTWFLHQYRSSSFRKDVCESTALETPLLCIGARAATWTRIVTTQSAHFLRVFAELAADRDLTTRAKEVADAWIAEDETHNSAAGDALEERFKQVLKKAYTPKPCSHCSKVLYGMPRCNRCKKARYCSRKCQKAAWTKHKRACK